MSRVGQLKRCVGCGRSGHDVRTCDEKTTINELRWKREERIWQYRDNWAETRWSRRHAGKCIYCGDKPATRVFTSGEIRKLSTCERHRNRKKRREEVQ